jgi:hypothetical protein
MAVAEEEKEFAKVVNQHTYTNYLSIPARWLKNLPNALSREVFELILVKPDPDNPFTWEIKIKPIGKREAQRLIESRKKKDGKSVSP